ncbi:MAG: hypothetical protein V3T09_01205 [bacterium]
MHLSTKILEKHIHHLMELCLYGMNFVDCGNSEVYNSQPVIKIKEKNDSQPGLAQTQRKTLLSSNLTGLHR